MMISDSVVVPNLIISLYASIGLMSTRSNARAAIAKAMISAIRAATTAVSSLPLFTRPSPGSAPVM